MNEEKYYKFECDECSSAGIIKLVESDYPAVHCPCCGAELLAKYAKLLDPDKLDEVF